jgi:YD repeat-containing protein
MRKSYYLLLFYLFCCLPARAQTSITDEGLKYTPALPPPPEAAALGKFGHTPVGLYTGVAQLSIPVYSIVLPGLELPISLDYHAGGIRVSETASSVGLGWALRAGGMISSTVMGSADFSDRGYVRGAPAVGFIPTNRLLRPKMLNIFTGASNADYAYLKKLTACPTVSSSSSGGPIHGYDTQPDLFQYSLGGRSGQFFHTQDGAAHPMPYEPLAITRLPGGRTSPWELGNGYVLVDEKGTRYTFDQLEVVATQVSKYGIPITAADDLNPHSFVYHLRRIETVRGDFLTFTYDTLTYHYQNVTSRVRYRKLAGNVCSGRGPGRTESISVVKSLLLKKITSNLGHAVDFEYSACRRLDLAGSRALTAIIVHEGALRRRFELRQGYFNGPATVCPDLNGQTTYDPTTPDNYRLKLVALQEVGKPSYTFTYREGSGYAMPPRLSAQEDHWGFINGTGGGGDYPIDPDNGFYDGYSREPDSTAMLTGMLREVHYPTGGYTRYAFEPNGYPLPADSVVTLATNSISLYPNDSAQNYILHRTFKIKNFQANSLLAFFNTPPCNQVTPQFTVDVSLRGAPVATYCGQSPPGGLSGDQTRGYNGGVEYDLQLQKYGNFGLDNDTYFRLIWQDRLVSYQPARFRCTGGVRIREAQDFDGIHAEPALRQRYYYTELDTTKSSATTLITTPVYTTYLDEYYRRNFNGDIATVSNTCHWLMQTTTTQTPLGSIQGSTTAYKSVLVLSDKRGEKGLTQHKFSFVYDTNLYAGFPFTQATSYDWARGLPVERTDFGYHPDKKYFYPLKRTRSHYTARLTAPAVPGEDSLYYVPAAQVNEVHALGLNPIINTPEFFRDLSSTSVAYFTAANFTVQAYKLLSVWQYKDQEQTSVFEAADSTRFHTTTTTYRYQNPAHAQVTATTSSGPNGDSLLTRLRYPLDFDTTVTRTPAAQAIRYLARTHQVGTALETQRLRYTPTAGHRVVGGELVEYAGRWPRRIRTLVTSAPLPAVSVAHLDKGALVADAHYQDALWLDQYDSRGNALTVHRPSGTPTAFLWNATTGEQVTQAKNCAYAQVACTSFEPAATGRWHYDTLGTHLVRGGQTGYWAYQLDGASTGQIERAQLPAGEYELTYWLQPASGRALPTLTIRNGTVTLPSQLVAQTASNWQLYRQRLRLTSTGAVGLNGPAGRLDEVRLYPVGALVTSATYDAQLGKTSQTDPTGHTVTYEYDELGRLIRTRDEQGRILSQQQYHYAGQ